MNHPPNDERSTLSIVGHTALKNILNGGVAGLIGAVCTYPLDMIKVQLQNQRGNDVYKNGVDVVVKIARQEGIRGLYRGVGTQLVGIVPEKAIKLTVNDLIRDYFSLKNDGQLSVVHEVIAGAVAGTSQVIITNPYELVKVRVQTAKHTPGVPRIGAIAVIRELGVLGLFTGGAATLLRDVPFSALYFTLYGNFKRMASKTEGGLTTPKVFLSGVTAGIIAGGAVTPLDVVKTRVQAKEGSEYKGIVDCFTRICKEEGVRALFKGTIPRMMIISPLFGITLAVYELMKDFI